MDFFEYSIVECSTRARGAVTISLERSFTNVLKHAMLYICIHLWLQKWRQSRLQSSCLIIVN
jgi:hypothetical protein